jgi:hypothetical protein
MARTWGLDDRAQLHPDADALLTQNLIPGERVMVIIRGSFDSALIATGRRAFVYKKGFFSGATFGKKLASYDYLNLTGVQLETGAMSGVVSLQGPGIASQDVSYWAGGVSANTSGPFPGCAQARKCQDMRATQARFAGRT